MSVMQVPAEMLAGFYYEDVENVMRKLSSFAMAGAGALHVVADFDLTLTTGVQEGQNVGTWDVMDALMPPEGVRRHSEIYQSLRPIELAGQLTDEIAREKWSQTLDLICSYQPRIGDVEQAFVAVAELRDGAKELFEMCEASGIPTIILSAGIRNVIEIIARYYAINPTAILSTELKVDDDGVIRGWQQESLIHMLNKREMGHHELFTVREARPNILLLGDVPDDAKMAEGDENVLRVRVLEPRCGETLEIKSALRSTFDAGYDLAVERNLQPVADLAGWICEHSSSPNSRVNPNHTARTDKAPSPHIHSARFSSGTQGR